MKQYIFLLLVLSLSFAVTFGQARQIVERTWTVNSSDDFEFNGSLPVNNSNQQVISITTNPEMEIHANDDGEIWLTYSGSGNTTLTATIILDIDYNTGMTVDPPVPDNVPNFTNITEPDEKIIFRAESLTNSSSSLATIQDMASWINDYIEYDLSYWGETKTAKEIFVDRKGVCVEYSHLLLSMLQSAGFNARYVSGYAYTTIWQPHAWVEIYIHGYGWLPADPTFNQIGVLDNSHIALAYGPDQSYIFDSISTPDPNASISVDDNIRTNYETSDPKGVEIDILLENNTVLFGLTNTRPFYTYGTLTTSMINTYEEQLLLLPPSQKTTIAKPLDESLLEDDFVYTVPVVAQFNDVEASTTFEVTTGNTGGNNDQGSLPQCTPVFIFALLLILAVKH